MRRSLVSGLAAASTVSSSSLSDVCTTSYVKNSLQSVMGISYGAVTANAVYNTTVQSGDNYPAASGRNFCNVTVNYSHEGKSDSINVWYYLPAPDQYKNRFLTTGGGGFAISSGSSMLEAGLVWGAAAGTTDGGFGSWSANLNDVVLYANGSLNYDSIFNFGYLSIHEMTVIGQGLSKNFYSLNSSKLYSYYQGCSEGGREGWSQVQRYGSQFDGASIGAPAMRQAFQQPNHNWPQIFESMNGYVPTTCELEQISNDMIDACDKLDGKEDGVVSRSDLCKLQYNATASIGKSFSCAASTSVNPITGGSGSTTPAANGTVTAEGVAVYQAMIDGPYDSKGRHIYIGFQPGADLSSNGGGTYDSSTGKYLATTSGIGNEWINNFLKEIESDDLDVSNTTADDLRAWMLQGLQKYRDTLETTWSDLEDLQTAGGKVIHWHGEADNSIPTDSSALYFEQVRRIMYGDLNYTQSLEKLNDFYRFFVVRGAQHCAPRDTNAPFPQTVLGSVIEWVENGVNPVRLNATFLSGDREGETEGLCSFPYRPMWASNSSTTPECVMPDEAALDSWRPSLNSIPLSVYGDA